MAKRCSLTFCGLIDQRRVVYVNILSPFGILYGRIMALRNHLYDRGLFRSYDLGARTISVGNLTTGGTGKTPLVGLIAKMLIDSGETVCILTRGYGRRDPKNRVLVSDGRKLLVDADAGGDEPVELALKLDGKAVIVADRDRVAAGLWAKEKFGITTFLLDDGFQHRRVKRGLDIVCIDAANPCGNGRILPAGRLRESFNGLRRADAIVITRSDLVDDVKGLELRLRKRDPAARIFKARAKLQGLIRLEDLHRDSPEPVSRPPGVLFAFTGIGDPENFFTTLRSGEIELADTESFPDHHKYSQADITNVEDKARKIAADGSVTTAKDAVKLKGLEFELPCYVAIAETLIDDVEAFRDLVTSS